MWGMSSRVSQVLIADCNLICDELLYLATGLRAISVSVIAVALFHKAADLFSERPSATCRIWGELSPVRDLARHKRFPK